MARENLDKGIVSLIRNRINRMFTELYGKTDGTESMGNIQASSITLTGVTPITYSDTVYEDLQVDVNRTKRGTSPPAERTYDFGTGGVAMAVSGFDVGESVFLTIQTQHSMKLNTILDLHIHFTVPDEAAGDLGDEFQFQLDVIASGIDGTWAVPSGSPFTATHTIAVGDSTKHRTLEIADIPAVNTTVSTVYECELKRIAAVGDEYGSEVYVIFADCHFKKDTAGSTEESSK